MRKLPDFLVCGAMKAGSTSLFHYLNKHPQISMYKKKEVHFFDDDKNFGKGIEWYKKHFKSFGSDIINGEITPGYMLLEKVPPRIKKIIPNVKLIFIVRNPIERAWSHYQHMVRRGLEDKDFLNALISEKKRIVKNERELRKFSYVERGMYAKQISRYLEIFNEDQIKILLLEDLRGNILKAMNEIFVFLNVKEIFSEDMFSSRYNEAKISKNPVLARRVKKSFLNRIPGFYKVFDKFALKPGKVEIPQKAREYLQNMFRQSNEELSIMINRDLSSWK